jgi:hypothetical protein
LFPKIIYHHFEYFKYRKILNNLQHLLIYAMAQL